MFESQIWVARYFPPLSQHAFSLTLKIVLYFLRIVNNDSGLVKLVYKTVNLATASLVCGESPVIRSNMFMLYWFHVYMFIYIYTHFFGKIHNCKCSFNGKVYIYLFILCMYVCVVVVCVCVCVWGGGGGGGLRLVTDSISTVSVVTLSFYLH